MSEKGFIHVYYGDGKGKTTAALGLAVRAAGCGKNVAIIQFLKSWKCGEHDSIMLLTNISLVCAKPAFAKFIKDMNDEEIKATKESQDECLKNAIDSVESGKCDVLILDEVIDAYNFDVLDKELLAGLIKNKPEPLELIITGHKPETWFLDHSDYVTEMVKHKHPYDNGVKARRGIEF